MIFDLDELRLRPIDVLQREYAREQKLAKMTPKEREAFLEAEEADELRYALSDIPWGKA